MLRNGEEVISEVKEICEPETEKPLGYHMHKPFRLDIVTAGSNEQGYQLEWFPWAPLSRIKISFYLEIMWSQYMNHLMLSSHSM